MYFELYVLEHNFRLSNSDRDVTSGRGVGGGIASVEMEEEESGVGRGRTLMEIEEGRMLVEMEDG